MSKLRMIINKWSMMIAIALTMLMRFYDCASVSRHDNELMSRKLDVVTTNLSSSPSPILTALLRKKSSNNIRHDDSPIRVFKINQRDQNATSTTTTSTTNNAHLINSLLTSMDDKNVKINKRFLDDLIYYLSDLIYKELDKGRKKQPSPGGKLSRRPNANLRNRHHHGVEKNCFDQLTQMDDYDPSRSWICEYTSLSSPDSNNNNNNRFCSCSYQYECVENEQYFFDYEDEEEHQDYENDYTNGPNPSNENPNENMYSLTNKNNILSNYNLFNGTNNNLFSDLPPPPPLPSSHRETYAKRIEHRCESDMQQLTNIKWDCKFYAADDDDFNEMTLKKKRNFHHHHNQHQNQNQQQQHLITSNTNSYCECYYKKQCTFQKIVFLNESM